MRSTPPASVPTREIDSLLSLTAPGVQGLAHAAPSPVPCRSTTSWPRSSLSIPPATADSPTLLRPAAGRDPAGTLRDPTRISRGAGQRLHQHRRRRHRLVLRPRTLAQVAAVCQVVGPLRHPSSRRSHLERVATVSRPSAPCAPSGAGMAATGTPAVAGRDVSVRQRPCSSQPLPSAYLRPGHYGSDLLQPTRRAGSYPEVRSWPAPLLIRIS